MQRRGEPSPWKKKLSGKKKERTDDKKRIRHPMHGVVNSLWLTNRLVRGRKGRKKRSVVKTIRSRKNMSCSNDMAEDSQVLYCLEISFRRMPHRRNRSEEERKRNSSSLNQKIRRKEGNGNFGIKRGKGRHIKPTVSTVLIGLATTKRNKIRGFSTSYLYSKKGRMPEKK